MQRTTLWSDADQPLQDRRSSWDLAVNRDICRLTLHNSLLDRDLVLAIPYEGLQLIFL